MNTGAEAWDSGVKLARRWGYDVKKVPENQAKVLVAKGNFHGRTLGAISASTDSDRCVTKRAAVELWAGRGAGIRWSLCHSLL
jgi:acetylornithine/succinyldiaminopimelate/putrescine aminotransferase